MFDMSQINEDEFHLDLGFMYGIRSKESDTPGDACIGFTTLPRKCCLKDLVRKLNNLIPAAKGFTKIKGTYYTWGLTKDVASLSIDFHPRHPFREIGLSFLQIYPSHKNLFDCQSHYPYPLDDDSGVSLSLDGHSLKAIYSTVGRPIPDLGIGRSSWRHSGGRIGVALRSHSNRSLHTRMELRVTETLRRKICIEIQRRWRQREAQPVEVIPIEAGCPFYIHRTEVINNFMTASTQVPTRLFQEIVSLAPEGHLSIDHQKLLVQTFQYQKVAHSAVLLEKFKYLYNSSVRVKPTRQELEEGIELREELGLGIKETIESYGYGYIKHGRVDWVELNFSDSHIAERFPHPSHALSHVIAIPDDRRRLNDLLQEIDFVIGRLRKERDEDFQEIQLEWLARRLVKQYIIDVTVYMINGPYDFANKERHAKGIRAEEDEEEGEEQDGSAALAISESETLIARQRARQSEDTDTDYEWHSSDSEV